MDGSHLSKRVSYWECIVFKSKQCCLNVPSRRPGPCRSHKQSLTICWLDLANAFLNQLFFSLPILLALRNILSNIYKDNQFQFFIGQQLVAIKPTSGVVQGEGSSTLQLSP